MNSLVGHLHALDHRSYAAYKAIVGHYDSPAGWTLHVDRVQPDPFAPPTAIRVSVPVTLPSLRTLDDDGLLLTPDRRLAVGARVLPRGLSGRRHEYVTPFLHFRAAYPLWAADSTKNAVNQGSGLHP